MPFSDSLSKPFFRIAQRDDRSGFPRLSATPVFKTRQQRFLKFFRELRSAILGEQDGQ